jgi:hypothetical protein
MLHHRCAIWPKSLVLKRPASTLTSNQKKKFFKHCVSTWPLSFVLPSIQSAVFMNEHRHLSQPYLRDFLLLRINYINRFKQIIEEGVQSGEFKKDIDTKLAVMTLFSSLNWMPMWYSPEGSIEPKELGRQLADMLVNGLKQN